MRAWGNVSDDHVGRRGRDTEKRSERVPPVSGLQARISARKAAGLDTKDDEKWLATQLDFLDILVNLMKEL